MIEGLCHKASSTRVYSCIDRQILSQLLDLALVKAVSLFALLLSILYMYDYKSSRHVINLIASYGKCTVIKVTVTK